MFVFRCRWFCRCHRKDYLYLKPRSVLASPSSNPCTKYPIILLRQSNLNRCCRFQEPPHSILRLSAGDNCHQYPRTQPLLWLCLLTKVLLLEQKQSLSLLFSFHISRYRMPLFPMFCLQQPFRNSQDTSPHLAVASVLETELEMVKDLDLATVTEKESE